MNKRKESSGRCRTMAVSIVLCLGLLSTACSTTPPVIVDPQPRPIPASLGPRPVPDFVGVTYRDLIIYAARIREAALAGEADKAAARKALGADEK